MDRRLEVLSPPSRFLVLVGASLAALAIGVLLLLASGQLAAQSLRLGVEVIPRTVQPVSPQYDAQASPFPVLVQWRSPAAVTPA